MVSYPPALEPYLSWSLFGNQGAVYLDALVLFAALLLVFGVFKAYGLWLLRRWADRTRTRYDDLAVEALEKLKWPFYWYLALYLASLTLALPPWLETLLRVVMIASVLWYAIKEAGVVIDFVAERQIAKRAQVDEQTSMISVLATLAKIVVWVFGVLLLLANLGIEITPLIAGLGIGGIAIAFALQSILEDLFSAFSIYFDKPFKRGDFIIVGTDMGVVDHVGLKTTRLTTLQGQQLVISNRELTSTRINNYKRMDRRRVQFEFGIEYGTPSARLHAVNDLVRSVVGGVEKATLDRTHFKEFGDSALIFQVVYYCESSDYTVFMDVQQEINFGIKDGCEGLGVSMAFPTTTVHLVRE